MFPDSEETGHLDIIWITGDLFDRELAFGDESSIEILAWMASFLRMCAKRDIVVRVLEGTPSHDRRQSRHFAEVNERYQIGADIKYVKTLSIEYIEKFDINVLYIPDEWKPDLDDVWKDVQEVMRHAQLTQVDYTIMHGAFNYQLPPVVTAPTHIPERYIGITKHYVFVGHIHLMSRYENILAAGSADRLSHGEESIKGHWRVTVRQNGNDSIQFIENKNAKLYITLDCARISIDTALETIDDFITKQLPLVRKDNAGSHLRIRAESGDAILAGMDVVKTRYPDYHWTVVVDKETKDIQSNLMVDHRRSFQQIHIGRDNLEELLMARIRTMTQQPEVIAQCESALKEILA